MPQEQNIPCQYCQDDCGIPYGLCHCGCGKTTNIASKTWALRKLVKDTPRKFVMGHQGKIRLPLETGPTFKIDGVYCRLIPLTRGLYTIVWESDYAYLMQWKWWADYNASSKRFYATRIEYLGKSDGKKIYRHVSMASAILTDLPDGYRPDHANGEPLDNRRSNLRPSNNSENTCNARKQERVEYKGVFYRRGSWWYEIGKSGTRYTGGPFSSAQQSLSARKDKLLIVHGEFARFE
jgi:hypothetical protein